MPHKVRVHEIASALFSTAAPDHGRALAGTVLTLLGLAIGIDGLRPVDSGREGRIRFHQVSATSSIRRPRAAE
jgi:hypothetical protein